VPRARPPRNPSTEKIAPQHSQHERKRRGRAEMPGISFREYKQRIREQFDAMFAHAGFDAKRDIAAIILNRLFVSQCHQGIDTHCAASWNVACG